MGPVQSNVKKFIAYKILSNFWFTIAVWVLFIQAFKITYFQIGLLEAVALIIILLLELPSGVFADVFGHKLTVFIAMITWGIGNLVVGFGNGFYIFLIGYAITGIGDAFRSGAESALLYESLRKLKKTKEYLKIKSRIRLFITLTVLVGCIFGPILFNINIRIPILLNGLLILCSAFIVISMTEPYHKKVKNSFAKHISFFKEAWKFSVNHQHVRWFIIFGIIITLPMGIFVNLMSPPYLIQIGFNVVHIGILFAIIHGTSGLIASFSDKIESRLKERFSIISIIIVQGVAFVFMALINAPIAAIAVMMLYISRDYKEMILDNYLNQHIKPKNRATVLSISQFAIDLSAAVFVIFGGYLTDLFSLNTSLIFLGGATLVFGIPHFLKRYKLLKNND